MGFKNTLFNKNEYFKSSTTYFGTLFSFNLKNLGLQLVGVFRIFCISLLAIFDVEYTDNYEYEEINTRFYSNLCFNINC